MGRFWADLHHLSECRVSAGEQVVVVTVVKKNHYSQWRGGKGWLIFLDSSGQWVQWVLRDNHAASRNIRKLDVGDHAKVFDLMFV